jgi:hypothetical protein
MLKISLELKLNGLNPEQATTVGITIQAYPLLIALIMPKIRLEFEFLIDS